MYADISARPPSLVDELLVQPRLVDLQVGICEEPVAVEPLDIVPFERAAVSPDVHVVFTHRADEHGACHRASDRCRVEVRHAGGGDVKRAALQNRQALGHQLHAAIDEAGPFGAVFQRPPRNAVVVGLVGLPEIRGVGERDRPLGAHPVKRRTGIESARKCDADFFSRRQPLKDGGHGPPILQAGFSPHELASGVLGRRLGFEGEIHGRRKMRPSGLQLHRLPTRRTRQVLQRSLQEGSWNDGVALRLPSSGLSNEVGQ